MISIRRIALAILPFLGLIAAKTVDIRRCGGKLYCPDHCEISYKSNGCPHNCNCGPVKQCPLVTCPGKSPICSIYTQLDGCQTCGCRQPYVVANTEGEKDELASGFVFVNRKDFGDIRRKLRDQPLEKTKFERVKIPETECTIPMMDKIDACISNATAFNELLQSKLADAVLITLNPIVKSDRSDLEEMCVLYRQAMLCMAPKIYNECRHSHASLAALDSVYGYMCGPKQNVFLSHVECIQNLHVESYRLAVCEDSAHRAIRFIEASHVDGELKKKQKCEALNWLMACEKSTIQKGCSAEASIVNDEALLSASQYVVSDCHPDFERKVFKSGEDVNLLRIETVRCSADQQKQINETFKKLESDVRSHAKKTSTAYAAAYGYRKQELERRCVDYNKALLRTKSAVKRNCIRRYATYNNVYFQLNYPCGHGTSDNFLNHFECLQSVRKLEPVIKCEKSAARSLDDPSNDPCDAYSILAECMFDHVVQKCGFDAWETDFQYMTHMVGNTIPNCRIKRIVRHPHFTPSRLAQTL